MKQLYIFILFLGLNSFGQNTVGVLKNDGNSYNGYTLFTPFNSTSTYLIDNCGQVINQWISSNTPAASVYLLENGNLLRTAKVANTEIIFGGVGGKIELFDWDNNLLWEYTYSSDLVTQHHDIYPLSNGNILMLAVSTLTQSDAIQAGRDPSQIDEGKLYNEQILELQPIGSSDANIVWEWNIKDHLIQDFDSSKDNYGVVENNPQLLDLNFLESTEGNANWLHVNSIQYNESLDQIILSSRILSEIYIIDHSTTTTEAALHVGGIYGKGGDFLYRWGNAESYRHGTDADQKLFNQHHPHWIPDGLTDAGKIMIFNNGLSREYSSIDIINPSVSSPGNYMFDTTNGFSPATAEWSYTAAPIPTDFFSAIVSNGQRLPNGNTLICDGDSGYFFEIDPSNTIVWEYINPDTNNGILTQGDEPSQNVVFRVKKFPKNYLAFNGNDLTPGLPIELNPNLSQCTTLTISDNSFNEILLYPNPVNDILYINTQISITKVEVYDLLGKIVKKYSTENQINLSDLKPSIYIVKLYNENYTSVRKIIKL